MPGRIEDYALIGDLETAALVGRDGSIDWLCWPRFDSDACFAALLGDARHGRWLLAPRERAAESTRRYRDDTLILETRFATSGGAAVVIDFMPPRGKASDVIRIVVGERGEVSMHTELVIRFGYGATVPWVTHEAADTWQAVAGPDRVTLHTQAPMRGKDLAHVADFVVREGETLSFVLTYSPSHVPRPPAPDVDHAFADTQRFWNDWVSRGRTPGRWSKAVTRSLVTLRALIYAPTGGIVAAPTTSLPEQLGGTRNWDYRFCWLRDATLTLLAFMNAGYLEEADAWRHWLLRAIAGSPNQAQIMYGVAGERRLTEWVVPWLPGYEGASPVRVGNGAHGQLQLDVFGELMDAVHQARQGGLVTLAAGWALQRKLLARLAAIWDQPDCGIWEMRGPPRHFTYSKVMAWVAFDRAIKDAERYRFDGPIGEWRALRERIHREVCERGYDTQRDCFVQSYGSRELDASLLLIAAVGFLPPQDPRFRGTVRAIEAELLRDGLVLRYDTSAARDGLPPGEGRFLACSFWLADAYVMCGQIEQAQALFERLLSLANDVGLLAEEYDPAARRMTGNFPQGFSHLSLVTTAFNLAHARKPLEQRSEAPITGGGGALTRDCD
ncbi:MAG: glycoside hydrolase family 15 protein [Candidatus Binatia bacterium]